LSTSLTSLKGRFGDQEYAIMTHHEKMGASNNSLQIAKEYELLLQGQYFHKRFVELATDCGVQLPSEWSSSCTRFISDLLEFHFHVEGAFLGKIVPDSQCADVAIPYDDFIATRLLPCAEIDGPTIKFTGNDDCGNPPAKNEILCMAIHAFSHFVPVYSHNQFLLCDLQGELQHVSSNKPLRLCKGHYDQNRIMCLFDPQSHS
jgi:hypothetical protein